MMIGTVNQGNLKTQSNFVLRGAVITRSIFSQILREDTP